jgi:hypothetical protein
MSFTASAKSSAPMADLASRLSKELADAAALAEDCQEAVGLAIGHEVRRDLTQRLQRLDELTQRLDDLADLMGRIAKADGLGAAPADVLDGLKLSALKERLGGGRLVVAASGEAELW